MQSYLNSTGHVYISRWNLNSNYIDYDSIEEDSVIAPLAWHPIIVYVARILQKYCIFGGPDTSTPILFWKIRAT